MTLHVDNDVEPQPTRDERRRPPRGHPSPRVSGLPQEVSRRHCWLGGDEREDFGSADHRLRAEPWRPNRPTAEFYGDGDVDNGVTHAGCAAMTACDSPPRRPALQ